MSRRLADPPLPLSEADLGQAATPHLEEPVPSTAEAEIDINRATINPYGPLGDETARFAGRWRKTDLLEELAYP